MADGAYSQVPDAPSMGMQLAMLAAQSQTQSDLLSRILPLIMQMSPAMGGAGGPTAQMSRMMLPFDLAMNIGRPRDPLIGAGMANVAGRAMMGAAAFGAFGDVQGAGGPALGGFGLGMGGIQQMQGAMEGMVGPRASMVDVAGITSQAGQGGFFRGITDVRQARQQLQTMVNTVVELSRELNMTIQDVSQGMNQVRGMGFSRPSQAAQVYRGMVQTAATTGMELQDVMGFAQTRGAGFWQQAGMRGNFIGMGAATETARGALGVVGTAARTGYLSDEMLMNTMGVGGQAGVGRFTENIMDLSARQMGRPSNQYMMAAFMDPGSGGINQQLVNQFMAGGIGIGQLQQMANRNISQIGGQGAWMDLQPQLQGQFQAATRGMGGLGFAMAGMAEMGVTATTPGAASIFGRLTGERNPLAARAMMGMMQNWGNIQETQQLAAQETERQLDRTRAFNERMQDSSLSKFVERTTGDFQRRASSAAESAVDWVSSRAQRLMGAEGPPEVSTGVGFGMQVMRGGMDTTARRQRLGGVQMGFDDPIARASESREAIRQLREEANRPGITPDERQRLMQRASEVEGQARVAGGESMFSGAAYWGSTAGAMEETQTQVAARSGVRADDERVTRYRDARRNLQGLISQFGQGLVGARGGEFQRRVAQALGVGEGELSKSTVVDILAGKTGDDAKRATEALLSVYNEFRPEGERALTAEERTSAAGEIERSLGAVRELRKASPQLSLGSMDILAGERGPTARWESYARAARGIAGEAFGGRGEGVVSAFQSNLAVGTSMARGLQGLTDAERGETKSMQDWLKKLNVSSAQIEEMFPGGVPTGKISGTQLQRLIDMSQESSAQVYRDRLLGAGFLAQDAAQSMSAYRTRGTEFQKKAANAFLAAHGKVEQGETEAALAMAERTVLDLTAPGISRRKLQELSGVIPETSLQKLEAIRGARARGGEGGERVTERELQGMGLNLEDVLGKDMAESIRSSRRPDQMLASGEIQRRVQAGLAQIALEPGRAPGTQAESATRPSPENQMRDSVRDGMITALTNTPLKFDTTQPILVKFQEGVFPAVVQPVQQPA